MRQRPRHPGRDSSDGGSRMTRLAGASPVVQGGVSPCSHAGVSDGW